MPQLDDLVAPELEAHGFRHPESVDVEDPAPYAELRHLLDHRHPFEAHRLQMARQLLRAPRVARPEFQPRALHGAGQSRALHDRARGRQQDPHPAARDALQCLDPFARDLRVGLDFAEAFPRRIERDRRIGRQRLQISQPPLGLRNPLGHDHDESARQSPRERGHQHGGRRPGESRERATLARSGECGEHMRERGQPFDRVEEEWEGHRVRAYRSPRITRPAASASRRRCRGARPGG